MTGTFDASHCGNSIVAKVQDILEAFFIFMFNNEYHVSISLMCPNPFNLEYELF